MTAKMIAISNQDFRIVMTEAYQKYYEAYEHWVRVEWVLRDQTNAKDKGIVADAHNKMMGAHARVMAVLGTITEISPGDRVRASIPGLLEDAAKRGAVGVQGT